MVDYKAGGNSKISLMDFILSADNLELSVTGIREIIGRLFYLFM